MQGSSCRQWLKQQGSRWPLNVQALADAQQQEETSARHAWPLIKWQGVWGWHSRAHSPGLRERELTSALVLIAAPGLQAIAYAEPLEQASARHMRAWKVWLVAGDCFLIGLAPVLVHMSKGPDGKFPFHPVSINLLVEVAKTFFATVVIMIYVSPTELPMP